MLRKFISIHRSENILHSFAQTLSYQLKPDDSGIPDSAYVVSFYVNESHFLLAIRVAATHPIACLKDGKDFNVDQIFIRNSFGESPIRASGGINTMTHRLGTQFDILSTEDSLVFLQKEKTLKTPVTDYRVTHHSLLPDLSKKITKDVYSDILCTKSFQPRSILVRPMKNSGNSIGNESCIGEIQTPYGSAACVLLEDGSVLMNLHLIFDIDRYKYRPQNPGDSPSDLRDFFCNLDSISAHFAHEDHLYSCTFDRIICCGLSLVEQASRNLPENWDFAILGSTENVKGYLQVNGLTFSQFDHTGITNMQMPTHYIHAPTLNFENMTYSYNTHLHSPNAVDPRMGKYTAILPDHEAKRVAGSSGSIALQDGALFLFNFQRGRLLPAVHLGYDINRAKTTEFNPFQSVDFSSVDTSLLTKDKSLKSNLVKKYQKDLPLDLDLKDAKINYHFGQLILNSDSSNFEHFVYELRYDCHTKSFPADQPFTSHELYLTTYGWNARSQGKVSMNVLSAQKMINLYRVVTYEDMKTLAKNDTSALRGHMGDYKQALTYLFGKVEGCRVLMEFTVEAQKLFSPENIALPDGNKPVSKSIKKSLEIECSGTYDVSHGAEGKARDDKLGMKEEAKGDVGFSFTFSSSTTHLRVQSFLDSMQPVLWTGMDGKLSVTSDGLTEEWQRLL